MLRVVTDTNADLNVEQARALGVDAMASTYVMFGEKSFRAAEMTPAQFHALLKSDPNFPKTSQPSVGDFEQIYAQFKGEEVISIHISRDLSGTIASAEAAAALMNGDPKITIVDTRQVSAGMALLVLEGVRLVKQGASAAEVKAHIESLIPRTRLHFVLETLENLRRGGRIGGAQALVGGILQMKPILTIKDGRVEPLERVRTFSKAVARLREIVLSDLQKATDPKYIVLHSASPQLGEEVAHALSSALGVPQVMTIEVGPTIATHAGPGAVGVGYIV
ncbi:MAG: DegV family protein [Anaerolineae bacterium]|nr:DegV family protein [Thermoflexales bacterium]MDW8395865.1 DegV family protein [Anaerolineae bacterium]